MIPSRRVPVVFVVLALAGPFSCPAQTANLRPPVSVEDLNLKDNPKCPGGSAMILYREIQTDSSKALETHFTRIKIFKEDGKKYADIEIPYVENELEVQNIRARTIMPDGETIDFGGIVYDSVIARTKGLKINTKKFTFPEVQPGSILEYSYELYRRRGVPEIFKRPRDYTVLMTTAYPAAKWMIQRELFVRQTHFVFHPFAQGTAVQIEALHLPEMAKAHKDVDGSFTIDVENVPPFEKEEYEPPGDFSRGRMDIFYTVGDFNNDDYWRDSARSQAQEVERFLGKSKAVQREAVRVISVADPPEVKLRKLYDRVQQLRFVSFERSRTEEERKRESLKPNRNAEDVLTRGYAFENEANLLFIALARAAGLEAYLARIASRDHSYFLKELPDLRQLDAEVVEVQLGDKSLFLDPANRYCPFGLLPWEKSDAGGIRVDSLRPKIVQTPSPTSQEAVISRTGTFQLDDHQNLQGKLEIRFAGREALERRLKANDEDETGRRKLLEDEVQSWLPKGATVKLMSASGWNESITPLAAMFDVVVPDFGSRVGERVLLSAFIFHAPLRDAFQSQQRTHQIDLQYGHKEIDELTFEAPHGYDWEHFPLPSSRKTGFASYLLAGEKQGAELRIRRVLDMNGYFFQARDYAGLRRFFEYLRTSDDEKIVLRAERTDASTSSSSQR